ncbi:MAG: hypothetical protein U5L07_07715 [Desulfobacterales bacterium]|nr:hypothetical protein [Desulfobacterales bacterium]
MTVFFDFYESVEPAALKLGDATYASEDIDSGFTDHVFFQSVFNPGHDGSTIFLEYDFSFKVEDNNATGEKFDSIKLQYRESGGSWVDIKAETDWSMSSFSGKGMITTAITLPIEVRLIATDTDGTANWQIVNFDGGSTYHVYFRAVGTVS